MQGALGGCPWLGRVACLCSQCSTHQSTDPLPHSAKVCISSTLSSVPSSSESCIMLLSSDEHTYSPPASSWCVSHRTERGGACLPRPRRVFTVRQQTPCSAPRPNGCARENVWRRRADLTAQDILCRHALYSVTASRDEGAITQLTTIKSGLDVTEFQ